MRSVILFGSIIISDAIRGIPNLPYSNATMIFLGFFIVIVMFMDVSDFFKNK